MINWSFAEILRPTFRWGRGHFLALLFLGLTSGCPGTSAQLQDRGENDAVRVTVAVNQDGSHTSYEFDKANHKAIATTTSARGKLLGKIRYDLDEAGRFSAGEIYGADGKLRFKARYKYDAAGRLSEETHLNQNDEVENRLVYSYDQSGRQTGYAIYDAHGNVVGQTQATGTPASTDPKKKR